MENINYLINTSPQIILFRDRKVFKKNRVCHNVNGAAIEPYNSSIPSKYYIKGEELTYEEWLKQSTVIKRRRKLKKLDIKD